MARSQIGEVTTELTTDTGSVLLSLVQGEQLEFPVTLSFLTNAYGYTYEAVLMEGLNVLGDDSVPSAARPSGVNNTLTVRVPVEKGTWAVGTTYDIEDVVEHPVSSGFFYKSRVDTNIGNTPGNNAYWLLHSPNTVYIQFGDKLTLVSAAPVWAAWTVQPTFTSSVYGFFELRVTAPVVSGIFTRTWKPMRGIVEFLYSPTQMV
jgi:hypothetical protein